MVLVGVQPVLMQVPPSCDRSTSATLHPWSARRFDSGPPDWPAPMTIASNFNGVPPLSRIYFAARVLRPGVYFFLWRNVPGDHIRELARHPTLRVFEGEEESGEEG
jgi:hypothetical protein